MGEQRRQWAPEFKRDAVNLVRSSGRPVAEIARELGVGESSLSYWVAKDRKERADRDPKRFAVGTAESEEVRRLRKRVVEAPRLSCRQLLLSIGVPSSPGRQPRQSRFLSEEGTSRPRSSPASTSAGYNSARAVHSHTEPPKEGAGNRAPSTTSRNLRGTAGLGPDAGGGRTLLIVRCGDEVAGNLHTSSGTGAPGSVGAARVCAVRGGYVPGVRDDVDSRSGATRQVPRY